MLGCRYLLLNSIFSVNKNFGHSYSYQVIKNDVSVSSEAFLYDEYACKKIGEKRVDGSYRDFIKLKRIDSTRAVRYTPAGTQQTILHWCSADCLGLSTHPTVIQTVSEAIRLHGIGTGGSRYSTNSIYHDLLERAIADLHSKERGLIFSSGYVANDAAISVLGKIFPGCEIVSDESNHASLIYGSRHSGARKHIFRHNDPVDLEACLSKIELTKPKIIIFESIHSMEGTICNVKEICRIAKKYGGFTYLDEAHGAGLYGESGGGIGEEVGALDKIDLISGSLNKAPGSVGGYIAGSESIVDLIRCNAPGFIFTAALPPALCLGAVEAIRVMKSKEGKVLRKKLQNNVEYMRLKLMEAKIPILNTACHFIPIMVNNAVICKQMSNKLLELGHFLPPINYPTVPLGTERFRLMPSSKHTQKNMDHFIDDLLRVWQECSN